MRSVFKLRMIFLVLVLSLVAAACAADSTEDTSTAGDTTVATEDEAVADEAMTEDEAMTDEAMTEDEAMTDEAMTDEAMTEGDHSDSATICDTDALVAAVEGGDEAGTLAGMADDPVATAASNNPVLTTLVTAVGAAGLGDTLNSAEALTVFAPTDCAFANLDPATLEAALADPTGLLTTVLGMHVIVGERIASADLSGEYETFSGATITVDGTTVADQAEIVVPDIETANATVHLIDTVMVPAS